LVAAAAARARGSPAAAAATDVVTALITTPRVCAMTVVSARSIGIPSAPVNTW